MSASITTQKDGIKDSLKGMMTRANTVSTFLQRVIYPQYQAAQEQRWQSENITQGPKWEPVGTEYASYKRKKYASYPGSGEKLMIATSKLAFAATGRSTDAYKLITNDMFVVGVNDEAIPYAKYAAEKRPIMEFSDETIRGWTDQIAHYVRGSK